MITLDFSEVKDQIVLDEGMYNVTIKKAEEKVSASGKPMLFVVFEEDETKSAIFENYLLTPEALWKLKDLLKAAGFDTSASMDFDPSELVGIPFKAKVIKEEYNGEERNKIKKVFAASLPLVGGVHNVILRTVRTVRKGFRRTSVC